MRVIRSGANGQARARQPGKDAPDGGPGCHDPQRSAEHDEEQPTDARLVNLARFLQSRLLTNDANLARVARLQNLLVLNLNDLAAAMRPSLAVGDELELNLVKEGRDPQQAVGYLPDGTMIVVNHGRTHLGQTVSVAVSSAVHTSAGRLIFAEIRNGKAS